jgi:hypothetical protein
VKGADNSSRPSVGWIREGRSKSIWGCSQVPSLFLYVWKIISSFAAWSVTIVPSSVVRAEIAFLLYLSVASVWKNLVFSSPNLVHLIVHLFSNKHSDILATWPNAFLEFS